MKNTAIVTVEASVALPAAVAMRETMPGLTPLEELVRLSTDVGFRQLAIRQAEWKFSSGDAPVFMYECAWRTPSYNGRWALHGVEIPFIFQRKHYGTAWDGHDNDALRSSADPQGDRFVVGKKMFDAWINFARTGNPSSAELIWPPYETERRATMIFDRETRIVNDPRSRIRIAIAKG